MRLSFADALAAAPRPRTSLLRYVILAFIGFVLIGWLRFSSSFPSTSTGFFSSTSHGQAPVAESPWSREGDGTPHPIDTLIKRAEEEFQSMLGKETKDLRSAAAAYRERRGRHPPPGFDVWHDYAARNGAVMVEEFFDQIYHDLNPFWGIDPYQIRDEAKRFHMIISIRNGNATTISEWFWAEIWHGLVSTIAEYLPDLDMPLNGMDESRLVVPWEKINEYMEAERKTRKMPRPSEVKTKYSGLADIDRANKAELLNEEWETYTPYFPIARRGCVPDSLARKSEIMTEWTQRPHISMQHAGPHSYKGYISNWTHSMSFCHQPDLQALHGYFIEPLSVKSSAHLMPLFGGSKLTTNNEILLPAPMYWGNDDRFKAGDQKAWEDKEDVMLWRGMATGGRNKAENWKGFHRHRFVSMVNGSQVRKAESWEEMPVNYELPPPLYDIKAARNGHVGDWLKTFTDVGFFLMNCWPRDDEVPTCEYIGDRIVAVDRLAMSDMFEARYLPDIDGNSFSGRYRAFLQSNSLPIKATIFREWHDSRIVPWLHFIPMDNRFHDIFGIMEYFHGYPAFGADDGAVPGNDAAARRIAAAGKQWADTVLRSEDMQIYVFRLLLEYARVSDDERENLGWVADIW